MANENNLCDDLTDAERETVRRALVACEVVRRMGDEVSADMPTPPWDRLPLSVAAAFAGARTPDDVWAASRAFRAQWAAMMGEPPRIGVGDFLGGAHFPDRVWEENIAELSESASDHIDAMQARRRES